MGLISKDPAKEQAKAEARAEKERAAEEARFWASPRGQARKAREESRTWVQIVAPIAVVLAVALSACSGEKPPVPDVVGERLDVARSDAETAGYDVEVRGGGLFGIVVEANWYVCEQRPEPGAPGGDLVTLVVDRTCAGATEPGPDDQTTGGGTQTFVMPDLVGAVLQDAQDQLQSLGSYSLDQEDASGVDRLQILDSNWIVCRQAPPPGTEVSLDKLVTLWSVKIGERCP